MSVKVMGWVWDQDIPRDEKFVLLAYADHADHDGQNVFPSIALVARKTGYSERSVQRITRKLVESGWLLEDGISDLQTNKYAIPIYRGDNLSPPTYSEKGDNLSGGDIPYKGGVTSVQEGVTKTTGGGDIAVSPEPSLTVKQPSIKREPPINDSGRVFRHYESNIGVITPKISELIGAAIDDYSEAWIEEAIDIAVENNVRKWSYVSAILARWGANGKGGKGKTKLERTGQDYIDSWGDYLAD